MRAVAEPASPGASILIIEDEDSIRDAVATALRYAGFRVRTADDAGSALTSIASSGPDLIVLDWMLPDMDGTELSRDLRARGCRTPILFLSAKDGIEDKVRALSAGGDDYVTKPFSLAELVARVGALLRRTEADVEDEVLSFGDIVLRERRRSVRHGAAAVELTDTEFAILRFFLLHPGEAITGAQILELVWLNDFDGSHNVVDTYVSSLGRKLAAAGTAALKSAGLSSYRLGPVMDSCAEEDGNRPRHTPARDV